MTLPKGLWPFGWHFFAGRSATAVGAVVAQLEGSALGFFALAHIAVTAADLDLIQSAGLSLTVVISAAVDGTLDAGIGFFGVHKPFPPLFGVLK